MPIKDPLKNREYKRLWIANHRRQQKSVEPAEPKNIVEPYLLFKCSHCPRKIRVEKKLAPAMGIYFLPVHASCAWPNE